jgi:uncharacterized RDD family membrane protein YckC
MNSDKQTRIKDKNTKGYLSKADKKKFSNIVGIFCVSFFFAQFIIPFVVMIKIMPQMMLSMMNELKPQSGVSWQDKIWIIEKSPEGDGAKFFTEGPGPFKSTLKSLDVLNQNENELIPATEADLPMEDPWLLSGRDRLWVISSSYIGFIDNGVVVSAADNIALGNISRPFMYKGNPAVIEERPSGYSLLAFSDNAWQEESPIVLSFGNNSSCCMSNIRVVTHGENIHFFLKQGGTLFYRDNFPVNNKESREAWQPVASIGSSWDVVLLQGVPAVFFREQKESASKIVGLRSNGSRWKRFFSHDSGLSFSMGVYPFSQGGFAVLRQTFPGSFSIVKTDAYGVVSEIKSGRGSFFPKDFMYMMFMPQLVMMFTPFFLALILTAFMKKYRVVDYEVGALRVPYASLTKRAIAQIIDVAVAGGPLLLVWLFAMSSFSDGDVLPTELFSNVANTFSLMIGGVIWVAVSLLLFSFMEGHWGISPGKRLVGIKVLGTDLKTCGFGRAIIRNLLKCVDGFFNFMIGIMVVALSENWQRIGDQAARTVVVDVRGSNENDLPQLEVAIS